MNAIDLSLTERSITAKVETLIGKMQNLTEQDIRTQFLDIIQSPDTYASPETRTKWISCVSTKKGKNPLMYMITNLYLAGANLSTNPK